MTQKVPGSLLSTAFVLLTDAATVAVDASTGNNFFLTLTASGHAMGAPSNPTDGQQADFFIATGAGGFTFTWNAVFDFGPEGAPTHTLTAGKWDWVRAKYSATAAKWQSNFRGASGGSAGTVTHTAGALTASAILIGNGAADTKVVAGITSDGVSVLTLGQAGTSVGGLALANATSGSVSIVPQTGALGASVVTAPALTGTMGIVQSSVILGSGSTSITRAAHLNRACVSAQASAISCVFAATGTSGAQAGDSFELLVTGTGLMTASGAISASPGYKLTAKKGETFTAIYDATADAFFSTTPAYLNLLMAEPGQFGPRNYGDNQFTAIGCSIPSQADSSVFGSPAQSDGSFGSWFRARMNAAATAANRGAGMTNAGGSMEFRYDNTASPNGRFPLVIRFAIGHTTTVGVCRVAVGLSQNTALATWYSGDPSAVGNDSFFIGADAGDANLQVMWNDNAGTCTKVDLGSNFVKAIDVPYIAVFDKTPAGVPFVTIMNRGNGVTASQIMNDANGPRNTQDFGYMAIVGSGSNATTLACIDIGTCTIGGQSL